MDQVVDGDTLKLANGRLVRLQGINAPELYHTQIHREPGSNAVTPQPLAREARDALQDLLSQHLLLPQSTRVGLIFLHADRDIPQDKYGRLLALVVNDQQQLLNQALIRQGLAWHVALEDSPYLHCLQEAEQQAKNNNLGIWALTVYQPVDSEKIQHLASGFQEVRGQIASISKSSKHVWLELEGFVVLRLEPDVFRVLKQKLMRKKSEGSDIIARGWLTERAGQSSAKHARQQKSVQRKPFIMPIRHISMLFLS